MKTRVVQVKRVILFRAIKGNKKIALPMLIWKAAVSRHIATCNVQK